MEVNSGKNMKEMAERNKKAKRFNIPFLLKIDGL